MVKKKILTSFEGLYFGLQMYALATLAHMVRRAIMEELNIILFSN